MASDLAAMNDGQFELPRMDTYLPQRDLAYYVEIVAAITKCVVPGFRSTVAVRMAKTDCAIGAVVIEELSHGTPLRGSKDDQQFIRNS